MLQLPLFPLRAFLTFRLFFSSRQISPKNMKGTANEIQIRKYRVTLIVINKCCITFSLAPSDGEFSTLGVGCGSVISNFFFTKKECSSVLLTQTLKESSSSTSNPSAVSKINRTLSTRHFDEAIDRIQQYYWQ